MDKQQDVQRMTLASSDLHKVLKELISAHNKWYNLGLALGLPSSTLDSIKAQYDSTKDCLREMSKEWLKRTNPKPSWRAVIVGLRDVTVEENQLAEEVEMKYCYETVSTSKGLILMCIYQYYYVILLH